jgi:crotonobetainyl-CoA:carnitine CoA-transferase CaiB-like acyl-CoA transferase
MVATVAHPSAGEVKLVASPLKLGRTPVVSPVAPPMLGQHSRTVLAELGYRTDEIEALLERGVIA